MKKMVLAFAVVMFACIAGGVCAEGQTASAAVSPAPDSVRVRPFQLALLNPAQVQPQETAIHGLALNLVYGRNSELHGLELGIVNRVDGDVKGLVYGGVNVIDGKIPTRLPDNGMQGQVTLRGTTVDHGKAGAGMVD